MNIDLLALGFPTGSELGIASLKASALADPRRPATLDIRVDTPPADDDLDDIVRSCVARAPTVLGLSCCMWNVEKNLRVASAVKEALPGTWIVLGGPEVSAREPDLIRSNPFVDVVVPGEGEDVFCDLIAARAGGSAVSDVAGVVCRGGSGVLATHAPAGPPDLDRLPSPFRRGNLEPRAGDTVFLETQRGCRYACRFCWLSTAADCGVRRYPMRRVESDLAYVLARRPGHLYITDPTFNADPDRAKSLCRRIARLNEGATGLSTELRAERVDDELAAAMRDAGFSHVGVGVQSVHASELKAMGRPHNHGRVVEGLRRLEAHGIGCELLVVHGLPDQTWESYLETLRQCVALRPAGLVVHTLMLLPNTWYREHADRLGIAYEQRPPYTITRHPSFDEERLRHGRLVGEFVTFLVNRCPRTAGLLARDLDADLVGVAEQAARGLAPDELPAPRKDSCVLLEQSGVGPALLLGLTQGVGIDQGFYRTLLETEAPLVP